MIKYIKYLNKLYISLFNTILKKAGFKNVIF